MAYQATYQLLAEWCLATVWMDFFLSPGSKFMVTPVPKRDREPGPAVTTEQKAGQRERRPRFITAFRWGLRFRIFLSCFHRLTEIDFIPALPASPIAWVTLP